MVANILPTDTPSTQGVGSNGQTISFTESSHVVGLWIFMQMAIRSDPRFMSYDSQIKLQVTG